MRKGRANIDIELDEEYYEMKKKRENNIKRQKNADIKRKENERLRKEKQHNKKVFMNLLIILLFTMTLTINIFMYTIGGAKNDIIYNIVKEIVNIFNENNSENNS